MAVSYTHLDVYKRQIQVGDKLIGFQAKYYAESVAMSSKEEDLRKAVEGDVYKRQG